MSKWEKKWNIILKYNFNGQGYLSHFIIQSTDEHESCYVKYNFLKTRYKKVMLCKFSKNLIYSCVMVLNSKILHLCLQFIHKWFIMLLNLQTSTAPPWRHLNMKFSGVKSLIKKKNDFDLDIRTIIKNRNIVISNSSYHLRVRCRGLI